MFFDCGKLQKFLVTLFGFYLMLSLQTYDVCLFPIMLCSYMNLDEN